MGIKFFNLTSRNLDNNIYKKIYQKAIPYYKKSRKFDVEHIDWLLSVADQIVDTENLDAEIFIPLILLHDIGYSEMNSDFWGKDTRKAHMEIGAKLTREILAEFNYDSLKSQKIVEYIAIHDQWALGNHEIYKNDRLLGIFSDLDFIWMASAVGFPFFMVELGKTKDELIDWLLSNEKLVNRPFASISTKQLFAKLIEQRKNEY